MGEFKDNGNWNTLVYEDGNLTYKYVNGKVLKYFNGKRGKNMVKEHSLGLMEESMSGNGRKGNMMVKERGLPLMEESMKGNGKMGDQMVKEQTFPLTEESM